MAFRPRQRPRSGIPGPALITRTRESIPETSSAGAKAPGGFLTARYRAASAAPSSLAALLPGLALALAFQLKDPRWVFGKEVASALVFVKK